MNPKVYTIASWIILALVALGFILASIGKLTGAAAPMFAGWGYPAWFATLIGVAELAGAIGLLIPKTTRYAVLGLTLVMFGACYTHIANGEGLQVLRPIIFLALLWTGFWLRRTASSPTLSPSSSGH